MKRFFSIILILSVCITFSQETPNFEAVDSLYREDQFYFVTTYNAIQNAPKAVSQNSFSAGLGIGFLRDFPINKSRTFAIAPGLGFAYNNYKQNLLISEKDGQRYYSVIDGAIDYKKNKFAIYSVDVPIEIRWRTSTFDSHKFWRIYTGVKLSYNFLNQSRYIGPNESFKINNNPDFNKITYGVYLTAGFNTWNLYGYYGLQNIFKTGSFNNEEPLKMNSLNLGLMFYIL